MKQLWSIIPSLTVFFLFQVGGYIQLQGQDSLSLWRESYALMGSSFQLIALHKDPYQAGKAVKAAVEEIRRIERLISSWDPNSQTSEINLKAGVSPVNVDRELFDLISRAQKVSSLTEGAFDISFASLDRVWQFHLPMDSLPDEDAISASVARINFQRIQLNAEETTVQLLDSGMKIGFGAIGKGYAANRAKVIMQSLGIENGLVNAGGDLICWGKDQDQPWRIGIVDPTARDQALAWIGISDLAVVTSGDYERFVEIEGVRYGHIIDPRTGWPVRELASVSIFCPDAELADALATSVMVLGPEQGLALINQLNGIEALLVSHEGEYWTSEGLDIAWLSKPEALEEASQLFIPQNP